MKLDLLRHWAPFGLLPCVMIGCGREPASEPVDTGAREAARAFYEAIIKKDWKTAHGELHQSQQLSLEEFTSLAEAYCARLGFQPAEVHVRACEEHGDEAIAHVNLSGRNEKQTQRYRDGIALRREAGRWRVIPPATFGKEK